MPITTTNPTQIGNNGMLKFDSRLDASVEINNAMNSCKHNDGDCDTDIIYKSVRFVLPCSWKVCLIA